MRLSEIDEYVSYANAIIKGDHLGALSALQIVISGKYNLDNAQKSFILSRIGRTSFFLGNVKQALNSFVESEDIANNNFAAKYEFAKFLIRDMKDFEFGKKKCLDSIDELSRNSFKETNNDISSQSYIERFRMLKSELPYH